MRSRSNGGVIGAYALPTQNHANGVFFIHDAAIYNTGPNPIWPLSSGFIYSATGGTISDAAAGFENYKLHTFTANGTFTVASGAAELEILLVGGGGSGGTSYNASAGTRSGGGGGGGGVVSVRTFVQPGTTFNVEVGAGGIMTTYGLYFNGKPSIATSNMGHSYTALGGGGGGNYSAAQYTGNPGGSGAGECGNSTSSTYNPGAGLQPSASTPGYGNAGGYANVGTGTTAVGNAGGGGGAGSPGRDSLDATFPTLSSRGGDGWLWDKTNCYYGAGGGGGRLTTADAGLYTTMVPTGLSGPYPGTISGQGGTGACANGVFGNYYLGKDVSSSWFYGVGGGGTLAYSTASQNNAYFGGTGGTGTVIFCYRYK